MTLKLRFSDFRLTVGDEKHGKLEIVHLRVSALYTIYQVCHHEQFILLGVPPYPISKMRIIKVPTYKIVVRIKRGII